LVVAAGDAIAGRQLCGHERAALPPRSLSK
jgi:hypothetical protein